MVFLFSDGKADWYAENKQETEKGSPEAEIIYNVELSKGEEWYDIIWSGSSKITITIPPFKDYWFKFYEINQ